MHRDVVGGLLLLTVAIVYLAGSWELPAGEVEPGPAFFPRILGGTLLFLAVSIPLSARRREQPRLMSFRPGRPLVIVFLTAAYPAAFYTLGFSIGTLAYTLGLSVLLGGRDTFGCVLIPVGATILTFALFGLGLGVPLPALGE